MTISLNVNSINGWNKGGGKKKKKKKKKEKKKKMEKKKKKKEKKKERKKEGRKERYDEWRTKLEELRVINYPCIKTMLAPKDNLYS